MTTHEVYDEYKVIDKGFSLIEEYWSNIIDATAGAAKEFSSLREKDIYKGSAKERLAIDQAVKIFKDASQRAIEFSGKAERLGGQGKEGLKKIFENVSKGFSEQAQSIKNSYSFHSDLKQTKTAYISEKHWKLAAKSADKLGPAATFIDLGIRASKGDFSGVASGALGAIAGLGFIAMIGATGVWAIPVAILAAGVGLATDKGLKTFFDYMIFDYLGLGHIDDQTNKNFNDAYGFIPRVDPLAIDLNGDGVQTISIDSGVLFDFNNDQMRTGTGWLDANDGFLAYDRNGNGMIDNGSELFGVDTRKSDGSLAKDGFDALRDLDSNGDGVFNSADTDFGNVRVWQDKNSDGVSQADELRTLDELGITAIHLDSQETNIDSNGNRIAATGTVEFADGSTSTAANLDLSSNPFYRKYTDTIEISEEIAALPDMQGSGAVRDLREAASQSTELAQLLEQYAELKTYAEQRALLDNLVNLFDRLESLSSGKAGEPKAAFMHSWLMQLREPNAYELAQQSLLEKIAILEAFNGRDFYSFTLQDNGNLYITAGSNVSSTVNPPSGKDVIVTETHLTINPEQAALLDKAYQTLLDSVYEALLPQTRLKPYLDSISLKWNGSDIAFDYSAVMQQLSTLSQSNAVEAVLLGFELKELLADSTFDEMLRSERINWISGLDSEKFMELNKHLISPWFSSKTNESIYIGTSENDTLKGNYKESSELYGGEGNDVLIAGYYSKDNILVGGKGNDTLYGSNAADTYLFNLGDGQDQIFENSEYNHYHDDNSIDTLQFGKDIRSEDISIRRDNTDLLFVHKNGTDQVSIKDVFSSSYSNWDNHWINYSRIVERVSFADGTEWTWDKIVQQGIMSYAADNGGAFNGSQFNDVIYGSDKADFISGYSGDDIIYGGKGDDVIDGGYGSNQLYGGSGNDILRVDEILSSNNLLSGGAGDDILYGSFNADTYLFNLGDGKDQIVEPTYNYHYGIDSLRFGEGIQSKDISMRREGHDFLFIHSNGSDQVLIKDVFSDNYSHWDGYRIDNDRVIEQIVFADGTVWNWDDIVQKGIASYVTGDEFIFKGSQVNDIIYGSAGDDVIYSHNGDDIIYGGDGNDFIDSGEGSNQLYGGAGNDVLRVDNYSENNLLVGGTGNDILYGGYGADTYVFNPGDGQDKIIEPENHRHYDTDDAIDKLVFGEGIRAEDLWFEQHGQDLIVKIIGTDDQVLVQNWYEGKGYRIDEFHIADGRLLLEAEVNKMVHAMAAFAPQAGSESNLTSIPREQFDSIIAVHWQ